MLSIEIISVLTALLFDSKQSKDALNHDTKTDH